MNAVATSALLALGALVVSPPLGARQRSAPRVPVVAALEPEADAAPPPPPAAAAVHKEEAGLWPANVPVPLVTKRARDASDEDAEWIQDEICNRVLVIYTGGTLGMTLQNGTLAPAKGYLQTVPGLLQTVAWWGPAGRLDLLASPMSS